MGNQISLKWFLSTVAGPEWAHLAQFTLRAHIIFFISFQPSFRMIIQLFWFGENSNHRDIQSNRLEDTDLWFLNRRSKCFRPHKIQCRI